MDLKKLYGQFVKIPFFPTVIAIMIGWYLVTMPYIKTSSASIPAMLVIVIFSYYVKYVFSMLFNKTKRAAITVTNTRLEELRCIPDKTMEQQKEFISLKYPKKQNGFKFSWEWLNKLLFVITIYIVIFKIFKYILYLSNISVTWLGAIIFMILFPLSLNYILGKFGVETSDISVYFRGGKRK